MGHHSRREAECQFCDKKIIQFTNRKPFGDWIHEGSRLNHCWRAGKLNRSEVATPKPGTVRAV